MKNKVDWYILAIIILASLISIISYPALPDQVATHWGTDNQPDDYSSKLTAVIITPALSLFFYGLFYILPKIDPSKHNYEKFSKSYTLIIRAIITFLLLIHVLVIGNGLGYSVNIGFFVPFAVGLLFVFLGNYMPRFQHNYFIGIRTPWTLANKEVWRKTHRFSAYLFVMGGILMMITVFIAAPWQFYLFMIVTGITAGGSILASYLFYRQEENKSTS